MGTRLSSELGKMHSGEEDEFRTVTPLLVQVGSPTATSTHGHWLRVRPLPLIVVEVIRNVRTVESNS